MDPGAELPLRKSFIVETCSVGLLSTRVAREGIAAILLGPAACI